MSERDTKFLGFARLLSDEIQKALRDASDTENLFDLEHTIIARGAYDLMQSGCIDISNAQMQQGGVTLHPHTMLRAVQDLTTWPEQT